MTNLEHRVIMSIFGLMIIVWIGFIWYMGQMIGGW